MGHRTRNPAPRDMVKHKLTSVCVETAGGTLASVISLHFSRGHGPLMVVEGRWDEAHLIASHPPSKPDSSLPISEAQGEPEFSGQNKSQSFKGI